MSRACVVAYYRVSDDEQGESRSPERQRDLLLSYARAHFPDLPVELVGDEGVSARTEHKRAGWQRVLKLLKAGQVEALLATDLSRLHRNTRDALTFANTWLVKRDVCLVLLHERVDLSNAAGRMAYTVLCAANQMHSDVTSDKVLAAFERKRQRGEWLGGHVPYGYTVSRGGQTGVPCLVPDPYEQRVLALMHQLREQGWTTTRIAQELNADRVPSKHGGLWSRHTVKKLLARPRNASG